jgi:hypothetical protein
MQPPIAEICADDIQITTIPLRNQWTLASAVALLEFSHAEIGSKTTAW